MTIDDSIHERVHIQHEVHEQLQTIHEQVQHDIVTRHDLVLQQI